MRWAGLTFACSRCGAVFADASALRGHTTRHVCDFDGAAQRGGLRHGAGDRSRAGRRSAGAPEARARPSVTYACARCGAGFLTSDGLRSHVVRHRLTMGDAPASVIAEARAALGREAATPAGDDARFAAVTLDSRSRGERRSRVAEAEPCNGASTRPSGERRVARLSRGRRRRRDTRRGLALLGATVLLLLLSTASALAWFTASTSGSATISTGTWGDGLSVSPGDSRAIHWSDCAPTRPLPIASRDEHGEIALDFGDALTGTCRTWTDVLRVTSAAPEPLRLSFSVDGAIAAFVGRVWLARGASADRLDPDETRSIGVRLAVPPNAAPGTYDGTLTVAVAGGTERHTFPMTLRVLCEKPRPSPGPSCSPSASPDAADEPTPVPSASPSISPSPSCSPTDTPSPSPSPSAAPTPTLLFTLSPGSTTVLPGSSAETPPVATLLPGDTLKLDFGEVPAGGAVEFEDVARMTSAAGETVAVTLALSGPVSGVVQRVGFSDGVGGIAGDGLSLAAGETARLAFGFDLGPDAPAGTAHGTLTVVAELAGVGTQRCDVPVAVTVVSGEEGPSPETAASPVAKLTLWLRHLLTLAQSPDGAPWRPPLFLVTWVD